MSQQPPSRLSSAQRKTRFTWAEVSGFWQKSMLNSQPVMRFGVLTASAFVCAMAISLFGGAFNSIEESVGSLGWTLFADPQIEERITLVVIDEPSINQIGPWPWSRADMARLVTAIDAAGAQLQLHDIVYPEPKEGDNEFLSALQAADGAVIAQVPVLTQQFRESNTGMMTHPIEGLSCNSEAPSPNLISAKNYVASAASLRAVPKGHNAALVDNDGAVRRSPAAVCIDGIAHPALSISAFLELGSATEWSGEISLGSMFMDPPATLELTGYPGLRIPLDASGAMRISFAKSPEAFRVISAADLISNRIDAPLLENTWVILGGTAFGMADIVPTPYSGAAFGIELQARLVTSILDGDMPYTPLGAPIILILISFAFGVSLYLVAGRGDRFASYGLPIAALGLPIISAFIHIWALASLNLWLGWMAPALFGLLGATSLLLLELGRVRMERTRVFSNLNSYLPQDVAREIALSLPSSNVNACRSDVTLLNADLRNFSAFSEARPPEEIAALLHFFFTRVTEIVEEKGGRVQEFRGDGILAIWDSADCATAQRALQAAETMQASLKDRLLPEGALLGLEPLALGVGIEQGPVLIGSIGPAHRRTYTLLGDTVSITLRIQEMTADLAQPILLGECVARQLSSADLQCQGNYLLSGLRIPHTLFALTPSANSPNPAIGSPATATASVRLPSLTVVRGGKS